MFCLKISVVVVTSYQSIPHVVPLRQVAFISSLMASHCFESIRSGWFSKETVRCFKYFILRSVFKSKNGSGMGLGYGHEGGSAGGMFIWLVRIGYIHGGFESKRPMVTIIESAWGLFYGDYLNQFLAQERMEREERHACQLHTLQIKNTVLHLYDKGEKREFHPISQHLSQQGNIKIEEEKLFSFHILCFGGRSLQPPDPYE